MHTTSSYLHTYAYAYDSQYPYELISDRSFYTTYIHACTNSNKYGYIRTCGFYEILCPLEKPVQAGTVCILASICFCVRHPSSSSQRFPQKGDAGPPDFCVCSDVSYILACTHATLVVYRSVSSVLPAVMNTSVRLYERILIYSCTRVLLLLQQEFQQRNSLIFAESVRTPAFCILILVYFDIFEDKSSRLSYITPTLIIQILLRGQNKNCSLKTHVEPSDKRLQNSVAKICVKVEQIPIDH